MAQLKNQSFDEFYHNVSAPSAPAVGTVIGNGIMTPIGVVPFNKTSTINSVSISSGGSGYGTITNTVSPQVYWNDQFKEYHIQGQMITYRMTIPCVQMEDYPLTELQVKEKMLDGLVKELFNCGHIEFTKMQEPITGDWKFHARMYAVPTTQVQILRTTGTK